MGVRNRGIEGEKGIKREKGRHWGESTRDGEFFCVKLNTRPHMIPE